MQWTIVQLLQKPQMNERTSSTICAVVGLSDHHCMAFHLSYPHAMRIATLKRSFVERKKSLKSSFCARIFKCWSIKMLLNRFKYHLSFIHSDKNLGFSSLPTTTFTQWVCFFLFFCCCASFNLFTSLALVPTKQYTYTKFPTHIRGLSVATSYSCDTVFKKKKNSKLAHQSTAV